MISREACSITRMHCHAETNTIDFDSFSHRALLVSHMIYCVGCNSSKKSSRDNLSRVPHFGGRFQRKVPGGEHGFSLLGDWNPELAKILKISCMTVGTNIIFSTLRSRAGSGFPGVVYKLYPPSKFINYLLRLVITSLDTMGTAMGQGNCSVKQRSEQLTGAQNAWSRWITAAHAI